MDLWLVVLGVGLLIGLIGLVVGTRSWGGPQLPERLPTPLPGPLLPAPLPPEHYTRYPVVLLHGAFGFDEVVVREQRHAYFRGVKERLEDHGVVVHRTTVPPVAGIARRAAELVEQVRALPAGKVNLIAHSMGGLDARYAIAHLGLSDRVASLVTLGTPHGGTPLADLGNALGRRVGLQWLVRDAGEMLADLTTEQMATFNKDVADVDGVFYGSVVGRIPPEATEVHPLLAPTYALLKRTVGDSDGLVPTSSQEWGEVLRIVDADHWAQVGWSVDQIDTPAIYEAIVAALRERGL